MTVSKEEIIGFQRFALEMLEGAGREVSWSELIGLWRLENPTPEDRPDIHRAIRQGLDDMAAGRVRPADEVIGELRAKHGLPPA
jgi:hypothetical protein